MPKLSPSGDIAAKRDAEAPNSFKKQGKGDSGSRVFGNSCPTPGSIGAKGDGPDSFKLRSH